MFERLDHFGAGHELGDGWQIGQTGQAELLQKGRRRAVQDGLTGTRVAAHLGHVTAGREGTQHTIWIDAADACDLGPRQGLLVGDDRQRLECGPAHTGPLAVEQETLDVGRQVGMALVAPATGNLHQLEAVARCCIGGRQFAAQLLDERHRLLEQLGELLGGNRLDGHHHDGLDRAHGVRVEPAGRGRVFTHDGVHPS